MWKTKRSRYVVLLAFGMLILGGLGFWWIGLAHGTPDVCCVIVRGVSHSKGGERLLSEGTEFRVDDPDIVAELASFFPGVGTHRFSYWESYCAYDIEIEFVFRDGRRVRAFTKNDFCRWGSDVDGEGFIVLGDLRAYLEALLYSPDIERIPAVGKDMEE